MRLFGLVPPIGEDTYKCLMTDTCRMMICCLVVKVLNFKEPPWEIFSYHREAVNRQTYNGRRLHCPIVRLEVEGIASRHIRRDTNLGMS